VDKYLLRFSGRLQHELDTVSYTYWRRHNHCERILAFLLHEGRVSSIEDNHKAFRKANTAADERIIDAREFGRGITAAANKNVVIFVPKRADIDKNSRNAGANRCSAGAPSYTTCISNPFADPASRRTANTRSSKRPNAGRSGSEAAQAKFTAGSD
jgi:hypothetical protein